MNAMSIEEMREYMSRPEGNCWVGVSMANGNTAMVSRYGITEEFICEYDGESRTEPTGKMAGISQAALMVQKSSVAQAV